MLFACTLSGLILPILQAGGALEEVAVHDLPLGWGSESFGTVAGLLEDVDLDGVADYAIASPEEAYGGIHISGAVRIYSGATHALLNTLSNLSYQEHFGYQLCSAGDVDQDGRGDIAIAGVLSPGPGSTVQVFSAFHGNLIWMAVTTDVNALANGGDLDGDGWDEILYGVADNVHGGVWFLSSKDGQVLGYKGFLTYYSTFGAAIANAGDLDGDGYPETIIGAPQSIYHPAYPQGRGTVYVFSFRRGELLHVFRGIGVQAGLGASVAGGKDVDGDGVPDILAGAPGNDRNARSHSAAVLFSGATGTRLWEWHFDTSRSAFGQDVALLDDADGDGRADLLIGTPQFDLPGLFFAGGALLVSGKTLRPLATLKRPQGPRYNLGWSVVSLGDLDGDQRSEFLVGSYSNFAGVFSFEPFLLADRDRISIAAGGTVNLHVDFPAASAGRPYRILASVGENDPGTRVGGWNVELNRDGVLNECLRGNFPPYAVGWKGSLDAAGDAFASFTPAPGQIPAAMAGRTLSLVAIEGPGGVVQNASALRQLLLEP